MVFGGKPMSIKRRDFLCGMGCCVAHSLKRGAIMGGGASFRFFVFYA